MKVIVATGNAGKLREFQRILEPLGFDVVSMKQEGIALDIVEDGDTFAANARIKAMTVHEHTGHAVIADDSGLCVDALGGGPGVYSARYGGEGLTDADRYRLVLEGLQGQLDRGAKFVSAICCAFPGGDRVEARGECPGVIGYAPQGENGFGYAPIFFLPEKKKTFAQLTGEEKNAISHRGKALEKFKEELEKYLTAEGGNQKKSC